MKKNKLFTLLRIFSKEEMKDFEKFIASPYFNKGRNFKPFYNVLKKYYPDYDSPYLTEENIFKEVYPGKTYEAGKSSVTIRVLESNLTRMAEKFLEIEEITKVNKYNKVAFMNMLGKKGDVDLIIYYGKKFLDEFETEKISKSRLLTEYLVRNELSEIRLQPNDRNWEFKKANMERTIELLITKFVSELIDYYESVYIFPSKYLPESEMLNEFNTSFDLRKFIESLEKNKLMNEELLVIIYYSYKISIDKNDFESFKKMKDLFLKIIDRLGYSFKMRVFAKLCNFCAYQNLGRKKFFDEEYIMLYKLWVEHTPNEHLDDVFNIIAIRNVMRRMKVSELKKYIDEYSGYFPSIIRDDCINYGYAILSFCNGDYEDCLVRINQHNFKIPMMIKDMKMMKIQTCYMLEHYDLIYSEIDAYRHFLASTIGIPKDFIENDKKVLKYFYRFTKITEKEDKKELLSFNDEIKRLNSENIYIKWINSTAERIINSEIILFFFDSTFQIQEWLFTFNYSLLTIY